MFSLSAILKAFKILVLSIILSLSEHFSQNLFKTNSLGNKDMNSTDMINFYSSPVILFVFKQTVDFNGAYEASIPSS